MANFVCLKGYRRPPATVEEIEGLVPGDYVRYDFVGDGQSWTFRVPGAGETFTTKKELPASSMWEKVSADVFGGDIGFGVHGRIERYVYRWLGK